MIEIKFDDSIRDDPELRERVVRASGFLQEELGGSAKSLVSAAWSLRCDAKGRTLLDLTFTDAFGESVHDELAPSELDNLNYFGARAYRLWGNLVREETLKDLKRLHEIVRGWEGREVGQN